MTWSKGNSPSKNAAPSWAFPVAAVVVVIGLALLGRKHRGAVENPVVDLAIITVGVFAFGAVARVIALKLNNPGAASFFGGTTPSPTTTIS